MLGASQQPLAPHAPALVCTYPHTYMIGYEGRSLNLPWKEKGDIEMGLEEFEQHPHTLHTIKSCRIADLAKKHIKLKF